ncbi:MAG: flagellin FliC [Kofleriaceae bacterium]|nr:flagellin FliC [Kofleriaceae bacterium]
MGISIVTNLPSLLAQRNLSKTQNNLSDSIGRLSSGLRINRAADDAAGLGISENLKADIRSITQAKRNANDAISLTQVAEGAMNELQGMVVRMRELAMQSANGTLGPTERGYIQTEFVQLQAEVNRISATTEFNGQLLMDGSASAGLTMQVGIHNSANDRLAMSITRLTTSTIGDSGVTGGMNIASVSLSTAAGAQAALDVFDTAIEQLSNSRSNLGALQNRIQITITNLSVAHENLSAANSRIRDVDVAEESGTLTKNQILSQAGIAILGQANQLPSAALSLIGG